MSQTRCPRCGAPQDDREADPLARCPWCGAVLAGSADLPPVPLRALPRIAPRIAVDSARAVLLARGETEVRLGTPRLVYYPFEVVSSPRRPYRPLAPLPPALAAGWRPSGADLVREPERDDEAAPAETADDGPPPLDGMRVPVQIPPRPGASTVHYPFWRVPADTGTGTAVWIDAIDGQAIDDRPDDDIAVDTNSDESTLRRWAIGALAAGILACLLAPFPWSLAPLGLAGAWIWLGGRGR